MTAVERDQRLRALAAKWNADPTYGICGCERCEMAKAVPSLLDATARLRMALVEITRLPCRSHRTDVACPTCVALAALAVDDEEATP